MQQHSLPLSKWQSGALHLQTVPWLDEKAPWFLAWPLLKTSKVVMVLYLICSHLIRNLNHKITGCDEKWRTDSLNVSVSYCIKDFLFVPPLAARVQSTLSSSKWDTDPAFWLVSVGLLLAELYEDVAARGFWELLLIWEFYFLTALFRDCRGRKAEALLCLISCTSIAQQVY